MPGCNQTRDIVNLQVQLITTILKLVRHDVPIVAIWYQENSVQTHGTKHMKDFILKLVQGDLEKAIEEDNFSLNQMGLCLMSLKTIVKQS